MKHSSTSSRIVNSLLQEQESNHSDKENNKSEDESICTESSGDSFEITEDNSLSPNKTKSSFPTKSKCSSPTKSKSSPSKSKSSSPTKIISLSPTKTKPSSPSKSKYSSFTTIKSSSLTKTKSSSATKTKTLSPAKTSPTKSKSSSPTKTKSSSPTKIKPSSPTKSKSSSFTTIKSSTKTKSLSPTKTKTLSPFKTSPTKIKSSSPTKTKTLSPTKTTSRTKSKSLLSPTKTKSSSVTKTKTLSPTKTKSSSPTKSKSSSPTKIKSSSPMKAISTRSRQPFGFNDDEEINSAVSIKDEYFDNHMEIETNISLSPYNVVPDAYAIRDGQEIMLEESVGSEIRQREEEFLNFADGEAQMQHFETNCLESEVRNHQSLEMSSLISDGEILDENKHLKAPIPPSQDTNESPVIPDGVSQIDKRIINHILHSEKLPTPLKPSESFQDANSESILNSPHESLRNEDKNNDSEFYDSDVTVYFQSPEISQPNKKNLRRKNKISLRNKELLKTKFNNTESDKDTSDEEYQISFGEVRDQSDADLSFPTPSISKNEKSKNNLSSNSVGHRKQDKSNYYHLTFHEKFGCRKKLIRSGPDEDKFSIKEDKDIITYIYKYSEINNIKGRRVWVQMLERDLLPGRTWYSIKERFTKRILPYIEEYASEGVNKNIIESFKKEYICDKEDCEESVPKIRNHYEDRFYTEAEKNNIVKFIVDNHRYHQIKGNKLYKTMAQKMTNPNRRSWQSLQNTFKRYIMPKIEVYVKSKQVAKNFKDAWNTKYRKGSKFPRISDEFNSSDISDDESMETSTPKRLRISEEMIEDESEVRNESTVVEWKLPKRIVKHPLNKLTKSHTESITKNKKNKRHLYTDNQTLFQATPSINLSKRNVTMKRKLDQESNIKSVKEASVKLNRLKGDLSPRSQLPSTSNHDQTIKFPSLSPQRENNEDVLLPQSVKEASVKLNRLKGDLSPRSQLPSTSNHDETIKFPSLSPQRENNEDVLLPQSLKSPEEFFRKLGLSSDNKVKSSDQSSPRNVRYRTRSWMENASPDIRKSKTLNKENKDYEISPNKLPIGSDSKISSKIRTRLLQQKK